MPSIMNLLFLLAPLLLPLTLAFANSCPVSLTQSEAQQFITRFNAIQYRKNSDLGTPAQTAQQIFAEDFTLTSYSVQSFLGGPLGATENRAAFINETTSHPGPKKITVLNSVARCDQISFEWQFDGVGTGLYPIRGFAYFTVRRVKTSRKQTSPIQAVKHAVEFDAIAWLLNSGGVVVYSNGTVNNPTGRKIGS